MLFSAIFAKIQLDEFFQNVLARVEIINSADDCNRGYNAHYDNRELVPNAFKARNQRADRINSAKENRDNADALQSRFPLATATCGHHEAFACGERSERFHAGLAEIN